MAVNLPERDLEGKLALVTGGSRGIGRAVSEHLARRGANVAIAYLRKSGSARETCAELEGYGVKAVAYRCNVADQSALAEMFELVDETFGRLDVLVSNAATGVIKPFEDLDARAWTWTMDANARALLLAANLGRPLMREGSSIVAMSSLGSTRVLPGYAVVGASKAAIEALVRYLAVELAPHGIRANTLCAGVVDTDALKHFPMREEMLEAARRSTPVGRMVTTEDVADAIDLLTSDKAAMVTGQSLVVDGGASLLAH